MTDLDVRTRNLRLARLLGAASMIAGALIAAAPALAQDVPAPKPATTAPAEDEEPTDPVAAPPAGENGFCDRSSASARNGLVAAAAPAGGPVSLVAGRSIQSSRIAFEPRSASSQ